MATTRLMPLHKGEGRSAGTAIKDIIEYVENPDKTDGFQLVSSYQCDSRSADMEFLFARKLYQYKTGRHRGKDEVIAYHLRQSFAPGEITPEEANRLGQELALRFTKGQHAFVVATHIDKRHVHNHIIINSVSLDHSRKLRNFWDSSRAIRRISDTICIENGYSVIADPKGFSKSYNTWEGTPARLSHRDRVCLAIDNALAQKPRSFDAFLALLKQAGYEVKGTANPSLKGGSQKRSLRMDTLGPGYSAAEIQDVINGKKNHTPKRAKRKEDNPEIKNNLLIDIQQKLEEGRGAGYANWAKRYNLKQMAQTVAFLQSNGLMSYDDLSQKAALAVSQFHTLSAEINSAEQRLQEISQLEKEIVNYARTRETYVAYRKAGYSKKFLSEHESEIVLHRAAKQFFDQRGLAKLPSLASLKAEFNDLLTKKNTAYSAYKKCREDMKELLTAKSNIEQIFGLRQAEKSRRRCEKQAIDKPDFEAISGKSRCCAAGTF